MIREKNERKYTSGITIIELMAAFAVVVILLLGFAITVIYVSRLNTISKEKTIASNIMNRKLEMIKSESFTSLWDKYKSGGTYTGEDVMYEGTKKLARWDTNTPNLQVLAEQFESYTTDTIVQITISVDWRSAVGGSHLSIRTKTLIGNIP